MASLSPIYAPLKRVSIPGFAACLNISSNTLNVGVGINKLELRSKENTIASLTRPLFEFQTLRKEKINSLMSLEVSLDVAEIENVPAIRIENFIQNYNNILKKNLSINNLVLNNFVIKNKLIPEMVMPLFFLTSTTNIEDTMT